MPVYLFRDTKTEETFDKFMGMDEKQPYLEANPHLESVITAPNVVAGVASSKTLRNDNGFKEVLSKISEAHPTSAVAEKHGRRTTKQIKTQQVVEKHRKRNNETSRTRLHK